VLLDIHEEKKNSDEKTKLQPFNNLKITTIDHLENLVIYKDSKVALSTNLRSMPHFPELQKHNFLFEMGYPYFFIYL